MSAVPAWTGLNLSELLALQALGATRFASVCSDANPHGRIYGGQLLAQALLAAARTVAPDRSPTLVQFLFLQGALTEQAITYDVTALQEGKRFSARHVRGSQDGGRLVLDAQVSFALPIAAPTHGQAAAFAVGEDPEQLPRLSDLPAHWAADVQRAGGYSFDCKPVIDFRLPVAALADGLVLDPAGPRLRYWVRLRHPLPDDAALQAAALAYLSDWWINYPAAGSHLRSADAAAGLYVASLNHALWLHRPVRADDWLHVDSTSPAAASGRGLSVARFHDRQGRLVASCTQESLMAPLGGA